MANMIYYGSTEPTGIIAITVLTILMAPHCRYPPGQWYQQNQQHDRDPPGQWQQYQQQYQQAWRQQWQQWQQRMTSCTTSSGATSTSTFTFTSSYEQAWQQHYQQQYQQQCQQQRPQQQCPQQCQQQHCDFQAQHHPQQFDGDRNEAILAASAAAIETPSVVTPAMLARAGIRSTEANQRVDEIATLRRLLGDYRPRRPRVLLIDDMQVPYYRRDADNARVWLV